MIGIYGIIIVIQAVLSSPVGVIPGILAFFLGIYIFASASHAKEFIDSKGKKLIEIINVLELMGRSFFLIGIIMSIMMGCYRTFWIYVYSFL